MVRNIRPLLWQDFKNVEAVAKQHYDPALPRHNFEHAKQTMIDAFGIAEYAAENGAEVEMSVLGAAALCHDVGYQDSPIKRGFSSKEELSASIARRVLDSLGMPADMIDRTSDAILSTAMSVP